MVTRGVRFARVESRKVDSATSVKVAGFKALSRLRRMWEPLSCAAPLPPYMNKESQT